MDFINENDAVNGLSDTVVKGGVCLYNTIKYIYSLAENDFYNVNIKDAFKVAFNNIYNADSLKVLGLRIDNNTCAEMSGKSYNAVLPLIIYSIAVRLPTLRNVRNGDDRMTDDQILKVYNAVISKGGANYNDTIKESFQEFRYLVRKGKPLPPYTAEWYKTYIYTNVPPLAEMTNKNMFLLGFADVLFAMFYACLEEELRGKIMEFSARAYSEPIEI
ncbi:MAG: hypothetical protein II773_10090 [Oscillospiraceae bacterium]|nr:hypothetical protein [Oscillospiraceae bacterium]